MSNARQDSVDLHVARWLPEVPELDPHVEGSVTRMQYILGHLRRARAVAWEDLGVTEADVHTLQTLIGFGPPYESTPAQLAEAQRVTRAGMTGRLDRLVEHGFVTRETDPVDRRRTVVRPTAEGRRVWHAAAVRGAEAETVSLEHLSDDERRQLSDLLRIVLLGFEDALD